MCVRSLSRGASLAAKASRVPAHVLRALQRLRVCLQACVTRGKGVTCACTRAKRFARVLAYLIIRVAFVMLRCCVFALVLLRRCLLLCSGPRVSQLRKSTPGGSKIEPRGLQNGGPEAPKSTPGGLLKPSRAETSIWRPPGTPPRAAPGPSGAKKTRWTGPGGLLGRKVDRFHPPGGGPGGPRSLPATLPDAFREGTFREDPSEAEKVRIINEC